MKVYDTIIIGGGQAGLATAYFLRRIDVDYLMLDDKKHPGGAWLQTWNSLKLFSPTSYSSLPGWQMPKSANEYPTKDEFIDYITAYEKRYDFPIQRDTTVLEVIKEDAVFKVITDTETFYTKTVVSATGTAQNPFIPTYPNAADFSGTQIHSSEYKNTTSLTNKKVLIVGGGNSGAQILAEVSKVAKTKWVTLQPPSFLPPDVDGRYLFNQANAVYFNTSEKPKKASLSDIVQVAAVKEGLERDIFNAVRPFEAFYENGVIWENGEKEPFDVIIWCTGFKASLDHLQPLAIQKNNRIETNVTAQPGLWLVGYGNWTGFASATIYGVGKTAKDTAQEIKEFLS